MQNVFSKLSIALLILLFSSSAFSQEKKYEMKENVFYVDGKAMFTLDEFSSNRSAELKDVILKGMDGKRIILFEYRETTDKTPYYELRFLANNTKAEIQFADITSLGKLVVDSELLKDGKLDVEAERKFVTENGDKFSKSK
jgi:hypothetical protein